MQAVLGALFVLTGAGCLLVEQALEKLLTTIVGASTTAGSLVLSLYFVGLAIGGLAYGRLRRRFPRVGPIRLYGALEGTVGAYALLVAVAFTPLQQASAHVVHFAGDAPFALFALRFVVASLWVLPPTICMGASFPAVVAALRERMSSPGREPPIVRFYALNLLGAMLGAVAGPYVLFAYLGLARAMIVLAFTQLAVLAVALLLDARARATTVDAANERAAERPLLEDMRALARRDGGPLILLTSFSSGLVIFSAEVVWLHLMGVTLGMSVYTFANMLVLVLAALFVGGAVASVLPPRRGPMPELAVPLILCAAAAAISVSARGWDDVPIAILSWRANVDGFYEGELVRTLLALPCVAAPCLVLGLVYPLLFRLAAFPSDFADRAAGILGGVNAAGSMVGALAVAFVLLPSLGSDGAVLVIATAPLLVALAWTVRIVRARGAGTLGPRAGVLAVAILGAAFVATQPPEWEPLRLTSGINVYFRPSFTQPSSKLVYWHEDAEGGITTVIADPQSGFRTLLTNGKFQGNDGGEMADQTAFSLFPCAATRGRARALVIGLGTGHSAAVVKDAGFQDVEVVDISRGIEGAARSVFAELNGNLLASPDVHFAHEDGRNHLLRSTKQYDAIGMELSSVWFAGVGNLYSKEFYELAREHLAPGGVMQQWVQLHHISEDEVISVLGTVRAVFPHVTLWTLGEQGVIVASMSPVELFPDVVADMQRRPALARSLSLVLTSEEISRDGALLEQLRSHQILDAEATTRLAADARARGVPLNTDANRFLEYWTPRHNLEPVDTAARNLAAIRAAARARAAAP